MAVTMKEIAREAGVHISTVDKVIHRREGVSDAVRAKVQRIIDKKGYRTNISGSLLQKQGKRFTIDVLLVDVDALPYIREGIQQVVKNHPEYNIRIRESVTAFRDVESQLALLEKSIKNKADGIIISPNNSPGIKEAINRASENGIPVITVSSDISDSSRICYVGQDGVRGAKVAGRIMGLFLGGSGNVVVITNAIDSENNDFNVHTREKQFAGFIKENYPGISIVEYIENYEDRALTYKKTKQLLKKRPDIDGIYITCGGVSEVGRAITESKRQNEIRVVSFEDYPEILDLLRDGVVDCTLGGNMSKQGRRSLEILMDKLLFGKDPDDDHEYIEIRSLVKESVY